MRIAVGNDQVWASDSDAPGVPIVFLHPGITDSTIWEGVHAHLPNHRLICFDRRGYGQSPAGTESYVPMDDLLAVLDHLQVERAHLVGNSMGGETALAVAVTAPERVASMTLLCPAVGGYPWPEPNEQEQQTYAEFGRLKDAQDWTGLSELLLGVWCASGADDYLRKQLLSTTLIELDTGGDSAAPNPEQWDLLERIDVPITVIAGDADPRDSLAASLDLADKVPGAELVRTPWDHLPQYREPELVAAVFTRTAARA